ncbi:DEKNAAC102889 [Brettanomyces naardenensis]|uniref:DEKNAAC102889 n=1 Tax=Brettanomyces naardenensis TaxID=13370 RepID=A0A448YM13_BRENA|nr:DEKNAAC102889 [Brettanomyces naardenensis]
MSSPSSTAPPPLIVPKPHILHDSDVETHVSFQPANTLGEAAKITFWSGVFLGGMQVRRLLQHRKGSARPGQGRYLALFELNKRHFVSIPLALGTYAFLSNSFYNLNGGRRTTKNEMISSATAVLVATAFKQGMAANKRVGFALGIAGFVGFFKWAGEFVGNYNTNLSYTRSHGLNHDQESNKDLDEDFANGTYKKQGFWEVMYRRPLSETVADLGEGRGIGKA